MGRALKAALRDLYENSWRLVVLNLALAVVVAALVFVASLGAPLVLALVAAGPFAAALMHCAVKLQQTDSLRIREGAVGLRLHWRRGLALGALVTAAAVLALNAVPFYAVRGSFAWPVALVAAYVTAMFALWQLHVWPLAVAHRREALRAVLRDAGVALLRRPFATTGLALVLLLVNGIGAIGIMPVLTLTIAYSALAAAHFALPPPTEEAPG